MTSHFSMETENKIIFKDFLFYTKNEYNYMKNKEIEKYIDETFKTLIKEDFCSCKIY